MEVVLKEDQRRCSEDNPLPYDGKIKAVLFVAPLIVFQASI
jgi:hypothetical protein